MGHEHLPGGLILGTSTSAYQIEGARSADGKGESIWDRFASRPGKIADGSSGDRACDHYNRVDEDVALLGDLAADAYRFSISWPRIQPEGTGRPNEPGLDFYDRLVDSLCERGISPFVTLYHWDLPQALEDRGGWTNRSIAGWFADYAGIVARRLGDRVDHWITLNEPLSVTGAGHVAGVHAPGHQSLIKAAKSVHFQLLAHGTATDSIRSVDDGAAIGIANAFSPIYASRRQDERIARRIGAVINEIFMDPLYFGHYPRQLSPLLHLLNRKIRSSDWDIIGRPPDFVGVNHYSRYIARRTIIPFLGFKFLKPLSENVVFTDIDWEVYPPAFRRILGWIRDRYGNPPVFVTENGASFDEPMQERRIYDYRRIDYLRQYMGEMLKAVSDGSDVKGYFVWSLLDNFEWAHGYTQRFGLVHVDYSTLERVKKESFRFYRDVCRTRTLPGGGDQSEDDRLNSASQPSES